MQSVTDIRNWNRLDGFAGPPQDLMTQEIVRRSGDRILTDGRCRIGGPANDSATLIPSEAAYCGIVQLALKYIF